MRILDLSIRRIYLAIFLEIDADLSGNVSDHAPRNTGALAACERHPTVVHGCKKVTKRKSCVAKRGVDVMSEITFFGQPCPFGIGVVQGL